MLLTLWQRLDLAQGGKSIVVTRTATARMKVFAAHLGFYDTVVAAPSKAAALRAWGVHQDLFAASEARITNDEQAVQAALAHPGIPLKRAVGSSDPFAVEAVSLPKMPDAPKASRRVPASKAQPAPRKPPADRSVLDAAEAKLRTIDDDRKRKEAEIERRQKALDAERETAQNAYVMSRKAAAEAVSSALRDYRKAGGEK